MALRHHSKANDEMACDESQAPPASWLADSVKKRTQLFGVRLGLYLLGLLPARIGSDFLSAMGNDLGFIWVNRFDLDRLLYVGVSLDFLLTLRVRLDPISLLESDPGIGLDLHQSGYPYYSRLTDVQHCIDERTVADGAWNREDAWVLTLLWQDLLNIEFLEKLSVFGNLFYGIERWNIDLHLPEQSEQVFIDPIFPC
ncbi:hypothetical protein CR513_47942, partial [Mucuna pruriens]